MPGGAAAQGRLLFWFVCLRGAGEWTHRSPPRAWETQSNSWHLTPVLSLLMAEGWGRRCQHEAQPNLLPVGFQLGDGRKWIIECNSFFFFRALAKKKSVSLLGAVWCEWRYVWLTECAHSFFSHLQLAALQRFPLRLLLWHSHIGSSVAKPFSPDWFCRVEEE